MQRFLPQTSKTLLAQDSLMKTPIVFVFGKNTGEICQRIANGTGAETLPCPDVKSAVEWYKPLKVNRKLGAVGINAAQAFDFAQQVQSKGGLNALVAFGGPGHLLVKTPTQWHTPLNDETLSLEKQWKQALERAGGIHSQGLHTMEIELCPWPTMDFRALDQPLPWVQKAWSKCFQFLFHHLKCH